ncbi:uncharacterized protein LOC113788867 [Dermatophagoides pteronyssinus]|uniref:Uncharacterized protein LOC113788867 n=2 Tax=Dermatophagoides pteronyssinus TaxID=6956 RepID=A0A6P6XMJ8_DERPT|nr:uncharacterized protein LOC113788867 [Dermatophagoides pteronyssinus]KAH9425066.1 hypothetical protein DERP_011794 [Dermatophagoides pteronyssinus]
MLSKDKILLQNTISESQVQEIAEKYCIAFKEHQLNADQELEYGQMLLQSPFEQDHLTAIQVFNEVIRFRRMDPAMTLEFYVGLIIGYIKIKDLDQAKNILETCRQRNSFNVEQLERLEMIEKWIKNRNQSFFWGAVTFAAGIAAIALMSAMGKKQ